MSFKDDTKLIISLGFISLLVLMSFLVYFALMQLQDLNSSMSNLVEETNAKIDAANSMRDSIRLRANSLNKMALSKDPFVRDEELLRFTNHSRIYRESRETLKNIRMGEREKEIHRKLKAATLASQPYNDLAAELLTSDATHSETTAALENAAEHQEKLLILLNQLVELEQTSAEQALMSANVSYSESRQLMFLLASIALILGLTIALLVIRRSSERNRHISFQANHDALTGLLNRRSFERELELLAHKFSGESEDNVLLYIDLDQFKIVNDTCGHTAGDELLRRLTVILRNELRQSDLLARLGGDEFGVLLKNCNTEGALRVAEALRASAENFQLSWDGKMFSVGISIGAVPFSQDYEDIAKVLSTADMACLEAKRSGRNRVRVADIDDQYILQRRNEMDCVGKIKQALNEDRLCLYYQPVVAVGPDVNQLAHVEILVRMISIDGELIQPGNFIPAAERYGLMINIDKWVIKQASQWLQAWQYDHAPPQLMINLSGKSVCDDEFLKFILEVLDSGNIRPNSICFEITETAAMENLEKAVSFINALKSRGCEFALDDFGSGLSSFAYLKKLPVDYLKIDGAFVKEIVNDPIDYAMVKSINEIGHVMEKKTIAEFVENEQILQKLKNIGVDYAQGYGIAKPQPLEGFDEKQL